MADFQETAREKIKQLSAKRAETRREAAYYLGEAGHDEAITRLAWLYKNDPDKSVRQAAKYALGQFRAVELALKHGDEERVVGLLEGIVNDGKMGRRLKTRPSRLALVAVILLLVFVGLVAALLLVPGKRPLPGPLAALKLPSASSQAAEPVSSDPTLLSLTAIEPAYSAIFSDTQTLLVQYQRVLTGGQLDCTAYFNGTTPIALDPADAAAHPEAAAAVQTINDAQAAVTAATARYQAACFQSQPLTTEELGGLLAPLVAAARDLPTAQMILANAAAAALITPTATLEPSITPAMTQRVIAPTAEEITPTVAPGISGANLVPLYNIISEMSDPRGPNKLLMQYWQDGKQANRTEGCDSDQPAMPDNYEMSDDEAKASPEVAQAVALINTGLEGVRRNWSLFAGACASRTLAQSADTGLQIANAADQAFQTAATVLDQVRKQ